MKSHVKTSQRTLDVVKPRWGWSWQEIAFLSTTFLGSFLLFQIQPLIGKMILPWFGGTASVWTMCLLFFQTVLFVGYLYAHLTSVYLAPRVQAILHSVVILAAMLTLPILPSDAWRESATANPGFGVLQVLAFSVGLPYFLLSTNAPLLQRWWAVVVKASPYHLYSLSNAGSLLALLTYTLIAERLLGTRMISYLWTILFVVLGLMLFRCLVWVWQRQASVAIKQSDSTDKLQLGQRRSKDQSATTQSGSVPTWTSRALWLFLASTGTTVLMSVTNFLCQDIASVPMMWLAPLTLYLLSFILCFSTQSWYRRKWFIPMMTVFSFLAAMTYGQLFTQISMTWLLSINLLALLGVFMVVHGEMERAKPAAEYLTQYFLFVSGGGMLGGFYVGLVAPLIYPEYYELPLVMILVGLIPLAILLLDGRSPLYRGRRAWAWIIVVAIFGWHGMVWSYGYLQRYNSVWSTGRNFYGVLKVSIGAVSPSSPTSPRMYVSLMNGHITHGSQLAEVAGEGEQQSLDLLPLPTTYYGEESAIGRIFRATQTIDRPRRIGAVGLGTGTIGSYAKKGDLFRFYEINPKVVEIAQETFSYLNLIRESEGDYEVVMGDARLSLESEPAQNYDVITVDAFSGDSIPVHLLTREAATIYLKHLHPDGYLAFHISNRYVDLKSVVFDIARKNGLELVQYQNKADYPTGVYQSEWVVLRRPGKNQVVPEFKFYPATMLRGKVTVWTDDRSSLLEVMKW